MKRHLTPALSPTGAERESSFAPFVLFCGQ